MFTLLASTSLQMMSADGTVSTLTLPTGVTLNAARRARFTTFGRYVVVCNSPSRPITVDGFGTVRVLTPYPPASPLILSGTAGGAYTGTVAARCTYLVRDTDGNIISESALGPASASAAIAAQYIKADGLGIAFDSITARRLYRTATGPTTGYFNWLDVEGNLQTAVVDDLADAGLSLFTAPDDLGSPPDLELVVEWKERLWGKDRQNPDSCRYTGNRKMYAWPAANEFKIPIAGGDTAGITAFMRRRDELGIAKAKSLHKVTGSRADNFTRLGAAEGIGCKSQESVVIIRDVAHFLAHDGVYTWGPNGVTSISRDLVNAWFTTDTYFNRSLFTSAFALWNQRYDIYQLHLAAAGSSTIDRWIGYDLKRKIWLGPHKTGALTPTAAGTIFDSNDSDLPAVAGSSGYVFKGNQTAFNDDSIAIDFSVDSKFHSGDAPDMTHVWLEMALLNKKETCTLTVTPKTGGLDAVAQTGIAVDLSTNDRERLRRLGVGRLCQLNFRNAVLNEGVTLYGYEIPWVEKGRR